MSGDAALMSGLRAADSAFEKLGLPAQGSDPCLTALPCDRLPQSQRTCTAATCCSCSNATGAGTPLGAKQYQAKLAVVAVLCCRYEHATGYALDPHPNFGATVGRVANRCGAAPAWQLAWCCGCTRHSPASSGFCSIVLQ